MDFHSRKILKYIKKKGQASFKELLRLGPNEAFCAQTLVDLNVNGYIIQVGVQEANEKQTVYELQSKGYAALEEHKNYALTQVIPVIISICALFVSILALFKP